MDEDSTGYGPSNAAQPRHAKKCGRFEFFLQVTHRRRQSIPQALIVQRHRDNFDSGQHGDDVEPQACNFHWQSGSEHLSLVGYCRRRDGLSAIQDYDVYRASRNYVIMPLVAGIEVHLE